MKKIFFIITTVILFACSTINFGTKKNEYIFDEEETNDIKEYDLSYQYKIMGINVKGNKTVVEDIFFYPEKKAQFIVISFPKIGILTTYDEGKTFISHFINSSYLNDIFGYSTDKNSEMDENKSNTRVIPQRVFCHFAISLINPNRIALSYGPILLLSEDYGKTWTEKKIFYDINNFTIKKIILDKNDNLIVFSNTSLAVSRNWGKKWESYPIHLPGLLKREYFKTKFVDALYNQANDIIYTSFIIGENDAILSRNSYDYLYNNKITNAKSGLFYSKDLGKTWVKTDINIPIVLWSYNNKIFGTTIYPLSLYKTNFTDKFKKSPLYRNGILTDKSTEVKEYVDILLKESPEDYAIFSSKNNKVISFNNGIKEYKVTTIDNFDLLYKGINKLQNLEYIQWSDSIYFEKRSQNFFYEYNFWRMYKLWTGMRTNSPTLYYKDNSTDIYYRVVMNPLVYKAFVKYIIKNQIKINSINPFLKKEGDVEFFDPSYDPSHGIPFLLQKSIDKGESWQEIAEAEHIKNMIDPLSNKQSSFFWYKNVDKKKYFKFQLSFGFGKEANLFVYPQKLGISEGKLLVQINYFSIINSYKDMYLFPTNISK